jgi:hypothetical protein
LRDLLRRAAGIARDGKAKEEPNGHIGVLLPRIPSCRRGLFVHMHKKESVTLLKVTIYKFAEMWYNEHNRTVCPFTTHGKTVGNLKGEIL